MRFTTLLFLSLLMFMSCGNDEMQEEPIVEKEGNCLTAKIDGTDFIAETTVGIFTITTIDYGTLGEVESKMITITGTIPSVTADTRVISLQFGCAEFTQDLDPEDTDTDCGVGMTYQITNFFNPNDATVILGLTGGINIQEVTDEKIKGTFSFNGQDQDGTSYSITDGFFDTTLN